MDAFKFCYDLSGLKNEERVQYLRKLSELVGLNPDENRLDTIWMDNDYGRSLVVYARRGTTDLLRKIHKISIVSLTQHDGPGYVSFTATAQNLEGRQEVAVGAYAIGTKSGDKLAAAVATAQTRACRRVTLQFIGSGILDESEVNAGITKAVESDPVSVEYHIPVAEEHKGDITVTLPPNSGDTIKVKRRKSKNVVSLDETPAVPASTPVSESTTVFIPEFGPPAVIPQYTDYKGTSELAKVETAQPTPAQPAPITGIISEEFRNFRNRKLAHYWVSILPAGGLNENASTKFKVFVGSFHDSPADKWTEDMWRNVLDRLEELHKKHGDKGFAELVLSSYEEMF